MTLLRQANQTAQRSVTEIQLKSPDSPPQFDVGLKTEKLVNSFAKEDQDKVGLDTTLKQTLLDADSVSFHYKTVRWSPEGMTEVGGCLLARLTSANRVYIYKEEEKARPEWEEVVDLSQLYNQCLMDGWPVLNKFSVSFKDIESRIYSMAATDIAWSPKWDCVQEDSDIEKNRPKYSGGLEQDSFSLLAMAVRSGEVVLWKVLCQTRSSDDWSLVLTTWVSDSEPQCIQWCPHSDRQTGLLAVGCHSGEVFVLEVSLGEEIEVLQKIILWAEKDRMAVSCLTWVKRVDCCVLLVSKEVFIMGFALQKKGDNFDCISATHTRGHHAIRGTAFAVSSGTDNSCVLMSSGDGYLQRLTVDLRYGDITIATEVLQVPLEKKKKWLIHGIDITRNAMSVMLIASPTSKFDHLAFRDPYQVHIINLVDVDKEVEALLHRVMSSDESLQSLADVMELLRQYVCRGKAFPSSFSWMWEVKDKWPSFSIRQLQTMRFFSLTRKAMAAASLNLKSEKLLPILQKEVKTLTDLILTQHALVVLKQLQGETILLRDEEKLSLRLMCQKVTEMSTEFGLTSSAQIADAVWKKFDLEDFPFEHCSICELELKPREDTHVTCDNNHKFGRCCVTLIACQNVPYRKCQVCDALSLPRQRLEDFPWISNSSLHSCTLCEGRLKL
ncbi:general transcription factor 3C polypeptide 4-like [Liolophura sinensis]|uniref:general transcription factor 3C polypeptide 4-like n=1 Tax=Liolophura sinensis TaxID=3198878 RepID=UPI003158B671